MTEVDERPPPRILRRERAMLELAAELIADRLAESWQAMPQPAYEAAAPLAPQGLSAPNQVLISGPPGTGSVDSVYTVSGGNALWPLSVFAHLATSVTVAERQLVLEYRTGDGQRYVVAGDPVTVSAGESQDFVWLAEAGGPTHPLAGAIVANLSQQHIYPGSQLAVRVFNGQAGDVLSGVLISARLDPLAE
jgi:hypothetical protein